MIGKAKSISHGINLLNYIMGESKNKKHPELIYHIKDNLLPSGLDAMGIWQMMELEKAKFKLVKNSLIRIEISPSKEYTQHFTEKDWEDLWNDFVREFDNYENINTKTGKVISPKTNIAASIQSVWLHMESRSHTPHLHGAVCRVDSNGHLNNDHMIHLRANIAAERVAIKRGWKTAKDVHDEKKKKLGMIASVLCARCHHGTGNNTFPVWKVWGTRWLHVTTRTTFFTVIHSSKTMPVTRHPNW